MNDSELNDLLRRARVPARTAEEWKELAGDTVRTLTSTLAGDIKAGRVAPRAPFRTQPHVSGARGATRPALWPWRSVARWAFAGATACVLCVLALNRRHADRIEPHNDVAEAQKLFSELNALFPNQLEGVVFDGSTPRLVLAEQTSQNKGTPLFVRLCGSHGCQRVITFSGQRVSLNGESCEVLVDARGHVIVTGERFVWSSGDASSSPGGYRIEAATLAGAL